MMIQFPNINGPVINSYSQSTPQTFINNDLGEARRIQGNTVLALTFVFNTDEFNTFSSFYDTLNQIEVFSASWNVQEDITEKVFRFTDVYQTTKLSSDLFQVTINALYLYNL